MGVGVRRAGVAASAAVVLLGPAVAVAGPAAALPSPCIQSGPVVTCTFTAPGPASWTVPAGVSQATFTVDGAAGGSSAGAGGLGGQVTATLTALSAGQVFTVSVGGAGQGPTPSDPFGAGGINGGGTGSKDAAGGGGFSSVTLNSTLELLAGGAGGGASLAGGGAGGNGGQNGSDGSPGAQFSDESGTLGGGGGGFAGGDATQPGAGGAGGTVTVAGADTCGSAEPGGQGGNGSADQGGGGGSFAGGGGGGYVGGGGGGGIAFDLCGHSSPGGGGGGSSIAAKSISGAVFASGVDPGNGGNGQVTIRYKDADLVIGTHGDVPPVDATGPHGATVTYTAPAVTDPDDTTSSATVSCSPASGSVFKIGTTTVTCTATDPDDANTPSTTFNVHVKGAAEQLADLAQAVAATRAGWILGRVVAVAQEQLAAGQQFLTCITLNVFIQEVRMYSPDPVPAGTAAQLIAAARQIQAVLGC